MDTSANMNESLAVSVAGTLSSPSKMPGYATSLDARACVTGGKLRKVKGSVCSKCYAMRGNYGFPSVRNAMAKRIAGITHPDWEDAMVFLILGHTSFSVPYFRWFDSGDLQSVEHLARIVRIADRTSGIQHWLPTHEVRIVKQFLDTGALIPDNLCIRLSATMLDGLPPKGLGLPTSTVSTNDNYLGHKCPSSEQGGKCLDCRACWNKQVTNVAYVIH
jgi:hypothetical protein